jgi:hypothetical protein
MSVPCMYRVHVRYLKIINMYIHVNTFLQMYHDIHVCTWYVHGMYIPGLVYVHRSDMYVHVYTIMYDFLNHINMYIQCINLYLECCVAHVQCTDGYIHFMKCTYIAEQGTYIDISFWIQLFYSPGWLAFWLGLAAACCHAYSSSSTQV